MPGKSGVRRTTKSTRGEDGYKLNSYPLQTRYLFVRMRQATTGRWALRLGTFQPSHQEATCISLARVARQRAMLRMRLRPAGRTRIPRHGCVDQKRVQVAIQPLRGRTYKVRVESIARAYDARTPSDSRNAPRRLFHRLSKFSLEVSTPL